MSSDDVGLPPVRLYVAEQSKRRLIEKLPENVKRWQPGFLTYPDNDIKPVKVRHRGDNPVNWVARKKSWRVKTKKKNLINGTRRFNYLAPQEADFLRNHLAYRLADLVGVHSPSSRLVELFVNDHSYGIYAEVEDLKENFLRNRNIMPVNIYKGEQYNSERILYSTNYLFNHPNAWTKRALFNRQHPKDAFDLERFLDKLVDAESSRAALDNLARIAPFKDWARFAAYQALVRSRHNSDVHNQRLIGDPWRGVVLPVVQDTVMSVPPESDLTHLESDANQPLDLLARVSGFATLKYDYLWSFLEQGALSDLAQEIEDSIPLLSASYSRDAYAAETSLITTGRWVPQSRQYMEDLWSEMAARLREWESTLRQGMIEGPRITWLQEGNQIAVTVDGAVPSGDLIMDDVFSAGQPTIVAWDRDNDGRLSQGDVALPFKTTGEGMVIEASFTANRVSSRSPDVATDISAGGLTVAPTTFLLVSDVPLNATSVAVTNAFTGVVTPAFRTDRKELQPTAYNTPVTTDEFRAPEVWSGRIDITRDRVVDHPVIIQPGTEISMWPGRSLTFRARVQANGTKQSPIKVFPADVGAEAWGAFSLVGPKTAGSVLQHLRAEGGSEAVTAGIYFSGMINLHDSRDIVVDGLVASRNKVSDDLVHIIYVENFLFSNFRLSDARSDAIDIDISSGVFRDGAIDNSGNDALDFMASDAFVTDVDLMRSGDKGISVGERTDILIKDSRFSENKIGIETRDGSRAYVLSSKFRDNNLHLNAYLKNWRYGAPGHALTLRAQFAGAGDLANAEDGSSLVISDSGVERTPHNSPDGVYVDPSSPQIGVPDLRSELPSVLARWNVDFVNAR
jgi:hypothetical protein